MVGGDAVADHGGRRRVAGESLHDQATVHGAQTAGTGEGAVEYTARMRVGKHARRTDQQRQERQSPDIAHRIQRTDGLGLHQLVDAFALDQGHVGAQHLRMTEAVGESALAMQVAQSPGTVFATDVDDAHGRTTLAAAILGAPEHGVTSPEQFLDELEPGLRPRAGTRCIAVECSNRHDIPCLRCSPADSGRAVPAGRHEAT